MTAEPLVTTITVTIRARAFEPIIRQVLFGAVRLGLLSEDRAVDLYARCGWKVFAS